MEPNDDNDSDEPTCKTCGRKLSLIGSMPKVDDRPRTRLYKCVSCQVVIAIPPLD
jgi:DNA-directed RNA polymerase subunit M/transcription elongation factor TFIIS